MAVPNASTPVSFEGAAAAALRLPEIAQYEYHDDVTAETVNKDLKLLETAWNTRLTLSIADEAKRTNSWSLLWKMEAAIVSLQRILASRILAVAERAEREANIPGLSKLAQKVIRQSHESVTDDAAIAAKMRDDPALVDQWYQRLEQKAATRVPTTTTGTRVPTTTTGRRVQFETGTKSTGTPARTRTLGNVQSELAAEQERARLDIAALREEAIAEIAAQRQAALADVRPAAVGAPVPAAAAARAPAPAAAPAAAVAPARNVAPNPPAGQIPAPVSVQRAQRNYYDLFNIFGIAGDLIMEHLQEKEGGGQETSKASVINDSTQQACRSRSERTDLELARAGGGSYRTPSRIGGATLSEEVDSLRRLDRALRQTIEQSDTMFSEMKRWVTSCGGDFDIPLFRPPVTGLDPIVARVVERLLWPRLQPSLFPVQRQITLYGPSGGGKSIVTSLIAYELVNQMRSQYVKTLVGDQGENAVKAARFRLPNSRFVIVYFVEAMKLRAGSSSPELIAYRLRNYLNCLQFEVVRASRRSQDALGTPDAVANEATGPLALLVIDNFDALFASEEELAKRPRRSRDPSALRSDLYRQPYDVAGFLTDLAGGSGGSRAGGRGSEPSSSNPPRGRVRTAGASPTSVESILGNDGTLATQWPDVRILRLERYPWLVPSSLNTTRIPRLFVDLPSAATRRSIITTTITNLLYRNMSAWLDERLRLQEEYRTTERLYTAKKARQRPFNLFAPSSLSSNTEAEKLNSDVHSLQRKLRGLRWVLTEDQRPPCSGPVQASSSSTFAPGETIDGQNLSSTGNEWGAGSGLEGAGAAGCTLPADARLRNVERSLRSMVTATYEQYLQQYFVRNTVSPSNWNILSRVIQQIPGAAAKLQEYLSLMRPTIEWLVASTGFALNGYCRLQIDGHLSQGEADTYLVMTGRRGPRGDGLSGVSDFGLSVEDLMRFMSFLRQVVTTRQMRQALDEQRAFIYGSELLAAPGCTRTARDALFQTGRQPPSRGLSDALAPPGSNISSNAANLLGQWSAPTPGLPTKVVVDPSESSTCALALGPDLRTLQDGAPAIPLSARYGSMRILKDDAVRALRAFMPRVAAKDDYPAFAAYVMRGTPTLPAPSSAVASICAASSSPSPVAMSPPVPAVASSPPTLSTSLFSPAGDRFAAFRPLIDAAAAI